MKIIGEATPEELPKAPIVDPIARVLGQVPGIGPTLEAAQKQGSPQGFWGPGIIARILGGLTGKNPTDVYNATIGPTETAAGIAGSMALPAATLPSRLMGGALIPMLEHVLQGKAMSEPGSGLLKGGIGAGTQGILEGVLGGVKQVGMRKAADKAEAAFEKKLAKYETDAAAIEGRNADAYYGAERQRGLDLGAYDAQVAKVKDTNAAQLTKAKRDYLLGKQATTAAYEKQVAAQQAAYEAAQQIHADGAAKLMMDGIKDKVPAFGVLPSDVGGLTTMVLGKGPKLLSEEFDKAMAQVIERAGAETIELPLQDIIALKLPIIEKKIAADPHEVVTAFTSAARAAEAVLGKGAKQPMLYRRVVDALDAAGIGDPAAREAYKTGYGFMDFVGKSGALEVTPMGSTFHTDAIVKSLSNPKMVDILRKRGLGDVDEGVINVTRPGTPEVPAEIPKPVVPPFQAPVKQALPKKPEPIDITPEPLPEEPLLSVGKPKSGSDIEVQDLGSRYQRAKAGAILGWLAGLGTGTGGSYYHSGPAAIGALAGIGLPNKWVTKAPGTEELTSLMGTLAQVGGAGARESILRSYDPSVAAVSPEDLVAIEAAKTALPDPTRTLQLGLDETR